MCEVVAPFGTLVSVVFNRPAFVKDHFKICPSKLLIIIIIKKKKKFQKGTFIDKGQRGKCFSTTSCLFVHASVHK